MPKPKPSPRVEESPQETVAAERSNILIVDDRSDKRVVFRTILEELEQNIVTVGSGEEALRWLLDNDSAVILLDVNMPGMDGLETAELIRSRRKSAHTPIIFITAFADEMHTARGYSLGAVDYILSPVVPNVLRSKVKALVQLHRLNAELKRRGDERVALVREQAARANAEESQRRASFLSEATQVMASSLDVDTILKGATGLAVPFLADYSAIVLIGDEGRVRARSPMRCATGSPMWAPRARRSTRSSRNARSSRSRRATPEPRPLRAPRGARAGRRARRSARLPAGDARQDARRAHAGPGPSARRLASADLTLAESLPARAASALDNCLLYEEIQNADRRKNEFLATLSHELRNPLAPLRSALHMLRGETLVRERQEQLLESMDRQVAQMTRLVEDLLDVSRITRGAIELRRETLDVARESATPSSRAACPIETGGTSSPCGFRRAVARGRRPRAPAADPREPHPQRGEVHGAGWIDRGFRRDGAWRRGHSRARQRHWHRARQAAARVGSLRAGGRVAGTHAQGPGHRPRAGAGPGEAPRRYCRGAQRWTGAGQHVHGAPAARGARRHDRQRKPEPKPQAASAPGKRILIVDDNVDAAETLAMMLELLGQETHQEHDGKAALKAAAEYRPEVVFLDIGLPG
jgi:CheY-like chemotaxis protein